MIYNTVVELWDSSLSWRIVPLPVGGLGTSELLYCALRHSAHCDRTGLLTKFKTCVSLRDHASFGLSNAISYNNLFFYVGICFWISTK